MINDPTSAWAAIAGFALVIGSSWLLARHFGAAVTSPGRYATLDGLRGYLAYGVFLHHSAVWYFFLRTGEWQVPPSRLYAHLGQSAVAFFFMITAFLFTGKLFDSRSTPIDWRRLYIGRVFRLAPLYFVTMVLMFIAVGLLSAGRPAHDAADIALNGLQWLLFCVPHAPDLNGVQHTSSRLMSGVTWSLPYEWFFYMALPCLAALLRPAEPRFSPWFAASLLLVVVGIALMPQRIHLVSFALGAVAAYAARSTRFGAIARGRMAPWLVLSLVGLAVVSSESAYRFMPLLTLGLAFALIASGCTLFGALTSATSRSLGELSYGIYLLQGLCFFVLFEGVIGIDRARMLTPLSHWSLVLATTPIFIVLCWLAFRWIEAPAMALTRHVRQASAPSCNKRQRRPNPFVDSRTTYGR